MAVARGRIPMDRRNSDNIDYYSGEPESVAFMIFGFLDEGEESPEGSCNSGNSFDGEDSVEDDGIACNVEENKAYWESQDRFLQETLSWTSSLESKVRHATMAALVELNLEGSGCVCRRPVAAIECRNCMRREVSDRLRNAGYNCAICKSKWKSSQDIPSGEHTYLEVVDNSSSKHGEVRVIIELNFRAEFEMARASREYNRLTDRLPEVFVGKAERLRALIQILCSAGKKCMKDKKMHMAPWRKQKYMQAKWLGMCERKVPAPILPAVEHLDRLPKPRASMLTFDMLENLPGLHCTAIKVV
ncbi:hypothetical protein F0562_010827 [Nyssa sinensis]|uniref:Uncharacterized protein n=1 Tax=Nyssa sinensis TaxID=561372 RepID=A0A5J5A3K0_9ASTE|nr:hypothetical protein F0562_010827 [Nyssa sinensis]